MNIKFDDVSYIKNYRQPNQENYLIRANMLFEEGKSYLVRGDNTKYILGRLIYNFIEPTFGEIRIGSYILKRGKRLKNIKKFRQNIAYLPYDYESKFNYKTVNNIFKEGLYNYNYRINEADSLVENIIDKTGCYLDYKKELVANLNSIQKYKLYLAGLLITNPKVIILEKIINDDKINDYLEELKNEQKITIIYIGNYKRTVDKSYVINSGIVSEVGL
jgi:ABC transporter